MKKFLLLIVVAMCFGFTSQKAMAAVTSVADLCGTYSFTATQVSAAEGYESAFPTSFEVTIEEYNENYVAIKGFAGAADQMLANVDLAAKTLTVESMAAYNSASSYTTVFSNGAGDYPYTQGAMVNYVISFDDEKNLTLADYSIVTVNHSVLSATILASFSNAVGVAQAASTETINFAGTYKVTSNGHYDYETGDNNPFNYDIVIEAGAEPNSYNITSIAGYTGTMVTATAEGNVLTINLGYNYLTTGATYDLLGDASYGNDYSAAGTLTITYEEGVYSMSDYSTWTATWTQEGTTYARKKFLANNTITSGPVQGGNEEPVETVDFAGTYSAKAGSYYNYETTQYCEMPFDIVIEAGTEPNSYNITKLASYNSIVYLGATAEGNVLTINGNYNYLTAGATFEQMGDASYSATQPSGEIKITYEDGSFVMDDFVVWTVTWSQEAGANVSSRKEVFSSITLTKKDDQTSIEDVKVEVDANAPVEYYNLQGVKVVNPSNGLFIKKQGNKAVKVIL